MEKNNRILIVDDQQDLREQLAKLLRRAGKKNETTSFVQSMRDRLTGAKKDEPKGQESADTYLVDTASQGEEAFEMVKKALAENRPYAMLFTDMRMPPGWDGMETAKKIRDIDKHIEIVIMTAFADHDQETIALEVGTPEKLLYIKKPFQSEEIFQLALSLTSKWNFEEVQRMRKEWLEVLIRSMSKVKMVTGVKIAELYSTTLKSILAFTSATKGFIVVWDETAAKWKIENFIGIEESEVAGFLDENSKRLYESKTTQSFDGKYLLPLKREGYSAVVIIYDVVTQSDPEWYKLLSLLVMTASEVLSNSSQNEQMVKRQQLSHIGVAVNKISSEGKKDLDNMFSDIKILSERLKGSENETIVNNLSEVVAKMYRRINNVIMFGNQESYTMEMINISNMISSILDSPDVRKISIKVETQCTGIRDAKINGVVICLEKAFLNMFYNSVKSAFNAKKELVKVTVDIKEENSNYVITFEDDGPGIPEKVKNILFEPFISAETGLGLGLVVARMAFEKSKGGIRYDNTFTQGARFVITLPKPQA